MFMILFTLLQSSPIDHGQAVSQPEALLNGSNPQLVVQPTAPDDRTSQEPDWRAYRKTAEAAVKAKLLDPSSAQFEWPFGFLNGTWKPFLGKRVSGYWTCGSVNARNRMGGYVGSTAFVVVMSGAHEVTYVDLGTSREFDILSAQCAKSVALLPPAPAEMSDEQLAAAPISVADELSKLARLRDQGVLSQAEFDAQKAKLLGK